MRTPRKVYTLGHATIREYAGLGHTRTLYGRTTAVEPDGDEYEADSLADAVSYLEHQAEERAAPRCPPQCDSRGLLGED